MSELPEVARRDPDSMVAGWLPLAVGAIGQVAVHRHKVTARSGEEGPMKKVWKEWLYRSRVRRRLRKLCMAERPAQQYRPYQRIAVEPKGHIEQTELRDIESAALGHGL